MIYSVEVVRRFSVETFPFYGKNSIEVSEKIDKRLTESKGLINKEPFRTINIISEEGVVMLSKSKGCYWI